MKYLLIVLLVFFGCDPSGGVDPLPTTPTVPTTPTTPDPVAPVVPVVPDDPAPVVPDELIKTAVDVPAYLWDVVNQVWILRLAYAPKTLIASADPYAKFCTTPGSIYTFEADGKITEYV